MERVRQFRHVEYYERTVNASVNVQILPGDTPPAPAPAPSLGTYYFRAGGGENVSLTDVTYECDQCRTVVFDAVKFSPR